MEMGLPEKELAEIITELKNTRDLFCSIINAAEPALFDDEMQRVGEAGQLISNGIDRLSLLLPSFDQ
jgi:hypothetical protein